MKKLEDYKQQARENLNTAKGMVLKEQEALR